MTDLERRRARRNTLSDTTWDAAAEVWRNDQLEGQARSSIVVLEAEQWRPNPVTKGAENISMPYPQLLLPKQRLPSLETLGMAPPQYRDSKHERPGIVMLGAILNEGWAGRVHQGEGYHLLRALAPGIGYS